MEVALNRLLELHGTQPIGLLDGLLDRQLLIFRQAKIGSRGRQLVLVEQIVHHHP